MSTIEEAVAAMRAGRPVVVPTDTVYGIAVDPSIPGATDGLFVVKERPPEVAIAVLCADVEQALGLAGNIPLDARRLAERFWPGGLTLVLGRRAGVDLDLGGDAGTIGVRVPDHPVPRELAALVGPLATTSANRHGQPTPETAAEVAAALGGSIDVVIDGGRCAGEPSTVVSFGPAGMQVLREGRIPASDLVAALS